MVAGSAAIFGHSIFGSSKIAFDAGGQRRHAVDIRIKGHGRMSPEISAPWYRVRYRSTQQRRNPSDIALRGK